MKIFSIFFMEIWLKKSSLRLTLKSRLYKNRSFIHLNTEISIHWVTIQMSRNNPILIWREFYVTFSGKIYVFVINLFLLYIFSSLIWPSERCLNFKTIIFSRKWRALNKCSCSPENLYYFQKKELTSKGSINFPDHIEEVVPGVL